MQMMTYDKDVALPETAQQIADIAQMLSDKKLEKGESLFVENFPAEHVAFLNSTLITGMHAAFYIKADAVYGGSGVRIFNVLDVKALAAPPARKEQDWTAPRKGILKWIGRFEKWFGFKFADKAFFWNDKANRVEIIPSDDTANPPADWYQISANDAIHFMSDEGAKYRNGRTKPYEGISTDFPSIDAWIGVGSVVWNYNATEDVVKQFASQADADYERSSKGIKYEFEDAPLTAWIAYNAAKAYHDTPTDKPAEEPVSDEDLDDL